MKTQLYLQLQYEHVAIGHLIRVQQFDQVGMI